MAKEKKDSFMGVKLPGSLKKRVVDEAEKRGESESWVTREALKEYFKRVDIAESEEKHLKKTPKRPRRNSVSS